MRKESDEIPESLAARLATHVGRGDEAVAVGDRAGIVEWTNSAWRRITGWPLEDVVGKPVAHMLDSVGLEPDVLEFIQSRFVAGLRAAVEVPVEAPDGRLVHIHLEVEPIADESGDIAHFVAIATDASARRQAELTLEHRRRREAVGNASEDGSSDARVAAAEAFAARSIDVLRSVQRLCLEIERTTAIGLLDEFGVRSVRERATSAVDATLALIEQANAGSTAAGSIDLGELVKRSLRRVRRDVPNRVQFDVVLDPTLPRVRGDELELAEAIERLMAAGLRAVDENWDTLSVTTGITKPGQPLVSPVHFQSYAGPLREDSPRGFVEIHDTGATIPPDQLRRLRGSLFPIPRAERLAELLAIRARLRGFGGDLDVSSVPGCGTRVLLLVPIVGESNERA